MKNLPKSLKTMQDIYNCYDLVKNEGYNASEFLNLLDAIKNRNYLSVYITNISDDMKTVTVNYCAEAEVNKKVTFNDTELTILSVTHNDGESDENENVTKVSSTIVLSGPIDKNSIFLYINEVPSIYETMELDKDEFDRIYYEIKSLV